jgi:hypothetical protein
MGVTGNYFFHLLFDAEPALKTLTNLDNRLLGLGFAQPHRDLVTLRVQINYPQDAGNKISKTKNKYNIA